MSNFNAYLINEFQKKSRQTKPRGKKLSKEEAREIIMSKCKKTWRKFLTEQWWISRTTHSGRDEYSFMDTTKMPARMSRNTANYYTHIINKDPSWKGYPRRQIIGTAGYKFQASSNIYVYFPYDGSKIGICKDMDIWYSFPNIRDLGLSYALSFNEFIERLLGSVMKSIVIDDPEKTYDQTLKIFKSRCKQFDWWFNGGDNEDKEMVKAMNRGMFESYRKTSSTARIFFKKYYKDDLYKAVLKVYSTDGFRLMESGKGNMDISKNNEVWFDSPCVVLDSITAEKFRLLDD